MFRNSCRGGDIEECICGTYYWYFGVYWICGDGVGKRSHARVMKVDVVALIIELFDEWVDFTRHIDHVNET